MGLGLLLALSACGTTPTAPDATLQDAPLSAPAASGLVAFPGAEGYGAGALSVCRGLPVAVHKVTTLEANGSGSLYDIVTNHLSDLAYDIVVFERGGTITTSKLKIKNSCVYIAGQTAPGDGVQIHNPTSAVLAVDRIGPSDIVIRHLRLRSTKVEPGTYDVADVSGGHDIMLDHLSMQFGSDEVFSIATIAGGQPATDITVQRSIIGAGLRPHSTGSLIAGGYDSKPVIDRLTFHHNLWAHNAHRNPLLQGPVNVQVINNVTYNWRNWAIGLGRGAEADIVKNYWLAGPWSENQVDRVLVVQDWEAMSVLYLEGNIADPAQLDPDADQRTFARFHSDGSPVPSSALADSRMAGPERKVTEQPAGMVLESVLGDVGANARLTCAGRLVPNSDALDALFLEQVRNRTGPASDEEADHPDDYGNIPTLAGGVACTDTDGDGMPDDFESLYGLDPTSAADASLDSDGDGYLNIEEYLNASN